MVMQKCIAIDDPAVFEEQVIGEVLVRDACHDVSIHVDPCGLPELDRAVQRIRADMRIAQGPCVLPRGLHPQRDRQGVHVRIDEGRGGFRSRGPGTGAALVVKRIEPFQRGRVRIVTGKGL